MKTKFKYIVLGSLLFGLSGFNSAKAITADELLVAVQQFAGQVGQAFEQVGQALGDHETRISDNEAKVTALENVDVATDARIAALEAEPKATIAVTAPTPFDDINAGFTGGSVWVDMADKNAYILVDGVPGAAVWKLITEAAPLYAIGDTGPAGGIVFYITDGGTEGYEAAPVDQGAAEWGCRGVAIPGPDRTDIDAGSANTTDILAGCATPGIAARLADTYSLNGFNDWFLPSRDQLNELYMKKDVVGGFIHDGYWSSSEIDEDGAWFQSFDGGIQVDGGKNGVAGVRAVRAF